MRLFSYCLRYDDGAAPNPFHGICTLAICKPAIRRVAKLDDWIVGLGSLNSPIGNTSGRVIYAMKVTKILSFEGYDEYCRQHLNFKIPYWRSNDFEKRVGDCIYDYSRRAGPFLRQSVHCEVNRDVDLSGKKVLLSDHFYYFGSSSIPLPHPLLPIVHQTQGHKSYTNDNYVDLFVTWLESLGLKRNHVHGDPKLKAEIMSNSRSRLKCSKRDKEEDEKDEIC